jgi:hypothetical protein
MTSQSRHMRSYCQSQAVRLAFILGISLSLIAKET